MDSTETPPTPTEPNATGIHSSDATIQSPSDTAATDVSPPTIPTSIIDSASSESVSLVARLKEEIRQLKLDLSVAKMKLETKKKREMPKLTLYQPPIMITFPQEAAELLKRELRLPTEFWRCFYEKSATLSSYMIEDCHANTHRNSESIAGIKKSNAFQALGNFPLEKVLTIEGLERHLVWSRTLPPMSGWVSVFNSESKVTKRCWFMYYKSGRVCRRVSVAKISTTGLVPAYFETNKKDFDDLTPVKIPIWVDAKVVPADRSAITIKQFNKSGSEVWLSILENKIGGFHLGDRQGQPEEWLAWRAIPKSRILAVFPYDGDILHQVRGSAEVRSRFSPEYVFDWDIWMWLNDPKFTGLATTLRCLFNRKRGAAIDELNQKGQSKKRQKVSKRQSGSLAQGTQQIANESQSLGDGNH